MTVQSDVSAPRPWYKTWWKLLLAIIFWPFFFAYVIFRNNWKHKVKIGSIAALCLLALISTSFWSSPKIPVDVSTVPRSNIQIKTESPKVEGQIGGVEILSPASEIISPVLTVAPTPTPTLTPTLKPTPRPTFKPVPTIAPQTQSSPDYYINVDGNKVQSPTYYNSPPVGATAKCGDGTYSFSQHRSGTCSHHGGVNTGTRIA